jgi:hypothetical protein
MQDNQDEIRYTLGELFRKGFILYRNDTKQRLIQRVFFSLVDGYISEYDQVANVSMKVCPNKVYLLFETLCSPTILIEADLITHKARILGSFSGLIFWVTIKHNKLLVLFNEEPELALWCICLETYVDCIVGYSAYFEAGDDYESVVKRMLHQSKTCTTKN